MTDKEFIIYIQKVQDLMTQVSTGGQRIENTDESYKELYFKLAKELKKRNIKNPNEYSSLWDFYGYWSRELPTYQNRRDFIRQLYKDILDEFFTNGTLDKLSAVTGSKEGSYTISLDDLHEDIVFKCKEHFMNKKYDDAILNALKLIEAKIREKGDFSESDLGVKLMDLAFSPEKTKFDIAKDNGETDGWRNIFRGIVGALKNPQSHRFVGIENPFEAFQILVFASYLLTFVDNLQIKEKELPF